MPSALDHIENAIAEVSTVRTAVKRKRSVQVTAADERDRLKAVAFAWFKTHRQAVVTHSSRLDVSGADDLYQKVLDATAKNAARTTYVKALDGAKAALLEIRREVAVGDSTQAPVNLGLAASTIESPPNFGPLAASPEMQAILNRRWEEVQRCIGADANLAATVMMGGLLETLLLARINSSPKQSAVFTANAAPRDKQGKTRGLSDWKLINMIAVAHELGWITKSAKHVTDVLRDFRNYIHPHKEHTDGVVITAEDARLFWEISRTISRQVIASVGSTP